LDHQGIKRNREGRLLKRKSSAITVTFEPKKGRRKREKRTQVERGGDGVTVGWHPEGKLKKKKEGQKVNEGYLCDGTMGVRTRKWGLEKAVLSTWERKSATRTKKGLVDGKRHL